MSTSTKIKILDRAVIVLINIFLIIATAVGPAMILASSPSYYRNQFRKTGIYATVDENGNTRAKTIYYIGGINGRYAKFTDGQLDTIADHIIDYLFGDAESFELTMDGVDLNGSTRDGVRIFGDAAVTHMADVRVLMRFGKWASIVCAILLPLLIYYVIRRKKEMGRVALQYTVLFYSALLLLLGGLALISLINANGDFFSTFWEYAHYLFFPFNPEKVQGSFFNDTLTMILSLDLFMSAVVIVLSILGTALTAWLIGAILIYRSYGRPCTAGQASSAKAPKKASSRILVSKKLPSAPKSGKKKKKRRKKR